LDECQTTKACSALVTMPSMHLSSMQLPLRPSSFCGRVERGFVDRDSALAAPNWLEDKHLTGSTLHAPGKRFPVERRPRLSGCQILRIHHLETNLCSTMKLYPLSHVFDIRIVKSITSCLLPLRRKKNNVFDRPEVSSSSYPPPYCQTNHKFPTHRVDASINSQLRPWHRSCLNS